MLYIASLKLVHLEGVKLLTDTAGKHLNGNYDSKEVMDRLDNWQDVLVW